MPEQPAGTEAIGRLIVVIAVVLLVIGAALMLLGRLGIHLRPLPGDVVIRRPGLVVYFPIVTMIVISAILSLIMYLISYFRR